MLITLWPEHFLILSKHVSFSQTIFAKIHGGFNVAILHLGLRPNTKLTKLTKLVKKQWQTFLSAKTFKKNLKSMKKVYFLLSLLLVEFD